MIKNILVFIGQLLLIAFLVFLAREAWTAYQQEKLNSVFAIEGKRVQVQVDKVGHEKLNWKDYIGNSKYISFHYQKNVYTIRYLQESAWVGEGTTVSLLYNARLDAFRQPGLRYSREPNVRSSKLVNWSVLSLFSYAGRWLFGFILLSAIIFLLTVSVLARITGLTLLDTLSGIIITLLFLAGTLYLTYDTISNNEYYKKIKTNGQLQDKIVLEKDRYNYGNETSSQFTKLYYYTATVRDDKGILQIAISENEYDGLQKGDTIKVLYDASADDMMSAGYSIEYWKWLFLAILWMLLVYSLLKKFRKRN